MTFTNEEAKALMAEIKENTRKLSGCTKHHFGDVVGEGGMALPPSQRKRACTHCGGKMEDQHIVVYARGYKAAGGNPDDVARYCDGESIK